MAARTAMATAMVMVTAMTTMDEGDEDNGKDDADDKDDNVRFGGIPDQYITINYMTAAEDWWQQRRWRR
jgi:hypothetical protein